MGNPTGNVTGPIMVQGPVPTHWYSTVLHFFHHLSVYVSDTFVALFGKDSAHTFAVGAESLLHSELGKIAMIAVQEVENMASGAEKNAAAMLKIAAGAEAAGLKVKDSLIKLLIEVAVARLKNLFGSALTP